MENLTCTVAIDGSEPSLVTVECSTTSGFAGLHLVGNTSDLCRDGKERAKTALEKLGLRFAQKRILINLSPADSRKEGNHYDLPIAVSLAALSRDEPMAHNPAEWLFAAELSLEGHLRPTRAVVPMLLRAQRSQLKGLVIAASHRAEIAALSHLPALRASLQVCYFEELKDVLAWLFHGEQAAGSVTPLAQPIDNEAILNFDDMHLSPELEDLAVTVAAGRHSLLLRGTPGAGKSMFAHRLPSIMPELSADTHLDALQVHSLVQEHLPANLMKGQPPFRHPHHAASPQAIIGTAQHAGELALAHGGILFLDELPEFRRDLLEALREPLEQGWVHVSRAQQKTAWKACVQFIAACNNCPCGWRGSKRRLCRCSHQKTAQYSLRLSGPLLDRIDIHFNMPELSGREWRVMGQGREPGLRTSSLCQRVQAALGFAAQRHERFGIRFNSALSSQHLPEALGYTEQQFQDTLEYLEKYRLSNRAVQRTLRVARTLADLEELHSVQSAQLERAALWQHEQAAKARGEIFDG